MVGNTTPVTAAPAGTPAPTVPNAKPVTGFHLPAGGNERPAAGRNLPVVELAELAAEVERAVERLNELMRTSQRSLRFRVDELSGRTVITVLDAETRRVVRQIPPPEWLEVVRRLEESGALLDDHS